MLERYQEELNLRGIKNLDQITEDGIFTKKLVNEDGKYESGYNGVISINNKGEVEVIFVRTETTGKRLVCDNFRGTYIQSDLSLLEDRDPVALFDDYSKDANLFMEIQRLIGYKYYMLYKATGVDEEEKEEITSVVDQEITDLQKKLESSKKM